MITKRVRPGNPPANIDFWDPLEPTQRKLWRARGVKNPRWRWLRNKKEASYKIVGKGKSNLKKRKKEKKSRLKWGELVKKERKKRNQG